MKKRLRRLEKEYGFQFRSDFEAFLKAHDLEGSVLVDDLEHPPGTSLVEPKPFWPVRFLGVDAQEALYAGADDSFDFGFWSVRLLPHAYVIGKSAGGDPIVQVTRGSRAGHVYATNHESWDGMFALLASDDPADHEELMEEIGDALEEAELELDAKAIRSLTTDQLFDVLTLEDLDGCIHLADDFDALLASLFTAEKKKKAAKKTAKAASKKAAKKAAKKTSKAASKSGAVGGYKKNMSEEELVKRRAAKLAWKAERRAKKAKKNG